MATFEELEPYRSRRIKFRCSKCRRILIELGCAPDPFGHGAPPPGMPLLVNARPGGWDLSNDRMARAVATGPGRRFSRPALAHEDAGRDWNEKRETWKCHPRCGAQYTLTGATISNRFLAAARAGSTEVLLGD